MNVVEDRTAGAQRESREFVDSLDRSSLGVFALDIRLLRTSDLIHRYGMRLDDAIDDDAFISAYGDACDELARLTDETGFSPADTQAEVFHWWRLYGELSLLAHTNKYPNSVLNSDSAQRLALVNLHPEMHGYFAAGVWDTSLIERLISDGVDPAISASLV